MPQATRTLNPLHFEDLEPHRFEDLVRQLAYDFRDWHSLEATGRLGADEGIDIRAVERGLVVAPMDEPDDEDAPVAVPQRLWYIQCKRERTIGPKDIADIVKKAIPSDGDVPYGFIVSAACDFSKKTRDKAFALAGERGVMEVHLWGKAELEDMLFQPKNDHLLFAYFSISLQARRRSMKSDFGARLATKKRLVKELGEIGQSSFKHVLLRNATATEYPRIADPDAFRSRPQWRYYTFLGHLWPDHAGFLVRRYFAYVDDDEKRWDAVMDFDDGWPSYPELAGLPPVDHKLRWRIQDFWNKIAERNRASYEIVGLLHYDRILVVDSIGDGLNEGPHLIVEYHPERGPFDSVMHRLEFGQMYGKRQHWHPADEDRLQFFPKEFPELSDDRDGNIVI